MVSLPKLFASVLPFLLFASPAYSSISSSPSFDTNQHQDQIAMGSKDSTNTTVYFGYGSNLWLHQMDMRCPTSKYLGVARLSGYRWIINDRGYANVVEVNNTTGEEADLDLDHDDRYKNVVFGLVYSLQEEDERRLDRNEGVPIAYTKEDLKCDFWPVAKPGKATPVDVSKHPKSVTKMLVYIDRNRTSEDDPKKEYIYRMNQGIKDAVAMGVPQKYVDEVMRKFIPEGDKDDERRRSVEEKALSQARRFEDESGVFERDDSK